MSQFPRPRMQEIGRAPDACTCTRRAWNRTCPRHGTLATPYPEREMGARRCPSTPSAGIGILRGMVEAVLPLLVAAALAATLAGADTVAGVICLVAYGWVGRSIADTIIRLRAGRRQQERVEAWIKAAASQRPPYVD